jgi:hypothetical protein
MKKDGFSVDSSDKTPIQSSVGIGQLLQNL